MTTMAIHADDNFAEAVRRYAERRLMGLTTTWNKPFAVRKCLLFLLLPTLK